MTPHHAAETRVKRCQILVGQRAIGEQQRQDEGIWDRHNPEWLTVDEVTRLPGVVRRHEGDVDAEVRQLPGEFDDAHLAPGSGRQHGIGANTNESQRRGSVIHAIIRKLAPDHPVAGRLPHKARCGQCRKLKIYHRRLYRESMTFDAESGPLLRGRPDPGRSTPKPQASRLDSELSCGGAISPSSIFQRADRLWS